MNKRDVFKAEKDGQGEDLGVHLQLELQRIYDQGIHPLLIYQELIQEINNIIPEKRAFYKDLKSVRAGRFSLELSRDFIRDMVLIMKGEDIGHLCDDAYDVQVNAFVRSHSPPIALLDENSFIRK